MEIINFASLNDEKRAIFLQR